MASRRAFSRFARPLSASAAALGAASVLHQRGASCRSSRADDDPLSRYTVGKVLGEGAFATVLHARRRSDGTDFAVKVMIKSYIEREGKTRLVLAESKALQRCASCDFVVNLSRTFQDADYLFFVLEFCGGGATPLLNIGGGANACCGGGGKPGTGMPGSGGIVGHGGGESAELRVRRGSGGNARHQPQ